MGSFTLDGDTQQPYRGGGVPASNPEAVTEVERAPGIVTSLQNWLMGEFLTIFKHKIPADFTEGIDANAIVSCAVQDFCTSPDGPEILKTEPRGIRPVARMIFNAVVRDMVTSMARKDNAMRLKYAAIGIEIARKYGFELPFLFNDVLCDIQALLITHGGSLPGVPEALLKKAMPLLREYDPGPRKEINAQLIQTQQQVLKPVDYRDVTAGIMAACDITELGRYAEQARTREDYQGAIVFQLEIVKRAPLYKIGLVFLAKDLEEIGRLEEALVHCLTFQTIAPTNAANNRHIADLRARIAARQAKTSQAANPDSVTDNPPPSIDRISFCTFFSSLRKVAQTFKAAPTGLPFRAIPRDMQDALNQDFRTFYLKAERGVKKGGINDAFWKTLDQLKKNLLSGIINPNKISTLLERTPRQLQAA